MRAHLKSIKFIAMMSLSLVLSGCGSRIDAISDTVDYAWNGPDDVSFTAEEIQRLSYPVNYLRWGNNPRIAVALVDATHGQRAWMSGSQQVVVTDNGRVVRTAGLSRNISYIENLESDPLTCIERQASGCELTWTSGIQVTDGFNTSEYKLTSKFTRVKQETLVTDAGVKLASELWRETMVSQQKPTRQWVNRYWIDMSTRQVVKSEQTPWFNYPSFKIFQVTSVKD